MFFAKAFLENKSSTRLICCICVMQINAAVADLGLAGTHSGISKVAWMLSANAPSCTAKISEVLPGPWKPIISQKPLSHTWYCCWYTLRPASSVLGFESWDGGCSIDRSVRRPHIGCLDASDSDSGLIVQHFSMSQYFQTFAPLLPHYARKTLQILNRCFLTDCVWNKSFFAQVSFNLSELLWNISGISPI